MASERAEAMAKLREACEHFPEICQEMDVSRFYCTCKRISPCLMAPGVKQLLQGFLDDFEVAARDSISCPQDFAVYCASECFRIFREKLRRWTDQVPFLCLERYMQTQLSSFARDLSQDLSQDFALLLLEPDEESFPPKEPCHFQIWERFAEAQVQQRQLCSMVAYLGVYQSSSMALKLKEDMKDSLQSFKDAHLEFEKEHVNSKVQHILGKFALATVEWFAFIMRLLDWTYQDYQSDWKKRKSQLKSGKVKSSYEVQVVRSYGPSSNKYKQCMVSPLEFVHLRRDDALKYLSNVSALASEVARHVSSHVSSLASPEMTSRPSWSVVSESPRAEGMPPTELIFEEVGSVASGYSADSQTSCLSGHGGPHCFLPSHLFKAFQSEAPAVSLVLAQDLQKGAKILSADGTTIQVAKVEKQKANKLLELERLGQIDDAVPLTITSSHRIVVPSDGEDATLMAVDVKLGNWVMCSDQVAKKVIGKREYVVEEQEVLSITFHPDKAVACFLPPEQPLVLTKGKTPRPTRRGGMGSRGFDVTSMPDTAACEYED